MTSPPTRFLIALASVSALASCGPQPQPLGIPFEDNQPTNHQAEEPDLQNTDQDDGDQSNGNGSNDKDTAHLRQLSPDEEALFNAINDHRQSLDLPEIPLSPSLTFVARTHVQDQLAHGEEILVVGCNLHSWSDHGAWSGCCYTPDHAEARCMWDKPRELTLYQNTGYEISAFGAESPEHALQLWLNSNRHRPVIENSGPWADYPWQAIGVGIEGGIAHVWFGVQSDPAGFIHYY